MWVEELTLTDFRNHERLHLALDARPVLIVGPNGSGKTNILEAISLLAPGQGLRRAELSEIARLAGSGRWAVAARVQTPSGAMTIGTGIAPDGDEDRGGRTVRIDGITQSGPIVLGEHVEVLWLVPAMDGLFTGPASERRRFLDRLVAVFDPPFRTLSGHFERAMRQRNRLLEDGVRDGARFSGLERIMAETGVAIAAARETAVAALATVIGRARGSDPESPFPWAEIVLDGILEAELRRRPAVEAEDWYAATLAERRERDRAAGRTLEGPHRTDLLVRHGPKGMPAGASSTGEQKALLVGLLLAQAELLAARRDGDPPLLLLDEVAAHLDSGRRRGLFDRLLRLGAQAWMTGTDHEPFDALGERAQLVRADDGGCFRRA